MQELINQKYLLQKMPGKGGWTFIVIAEIPKEKRGGNKEVRVSGKIDEYQLKDIHLMPMKDGNLFMPIKAEIRKAIGKEAGEWVDLIFFTEDQFIDETFDDTEALLLCLADEPKAKQIFLSFTSTEQQTFINYIAEAKNDKTKVERIAKTIDLLLTGRKAFNP
jgi:hypothetical protein